MNRHGLLIFADREAEKRTLDDSKDVNDNVVRRMIIKVLTVRISSPCCLVKGTEISSTRMK